MTKQRPHRVTRITLTVLSFLAVCTALALGLVLGVLAVLRVIGDAL